MKICLILGFALISTNCTNFRLEIRTKTKRLRSLWPAGHCACARTTWPVAPSYSSIFLVDACRTDVWQLLGEFDFILLSTMSQTWNCTLIRLADVQCICCVCFRAKYPPQSGIFGFEKSNIFGSHKNVFRHFVLLLNYMRPSPWCIRYR